MYQKCMDQCQTQRMYNTKSAHFCKLWTPVENSVPV